MNDFYLPAYCTQPSDHWPLPHPLPGVRMVSTAFDAALLHPEDFQRCGVPNVNGVVKRQAEHLAGRLCAREALRALTGVAEVPAVGEDRAPQWPAGVAGSISHGAGWAGAVVAQRSAWRGLGLDVEKHLPEQRAERLAAQILTPAELSRLEGLSTMQRATRIGLTFSLKESLFKALYPLVLRQFYFHDAELVDTDPNGHASLRLLIDLHADWPAGSQLQGQFAEFDGYLLSLIGIPA
nr:4'-phosphopantetheinyl transferase superfamily protein [uncultured Pseudomonas sp.]